MNSQSHLAHHGIKGQKWGERRFQNEDGSLTPAGKERYYKNVPVNVEEKRNGLADAKKAYDTALQNYNRTTYYGQFVNADASKKLSDAGNLLRVAKKDYDDAKVREKLNETTRTKSNHRLKLEEKYMQQGMTKEEAEVAAYKRVVTERTIAIAAGVTLAAAAGYAAYRYHDDVADKILKSGTTLHNVSRFGNKGVEDAFYASMHKSDNDKYIGMYGKVLSEKGQRQVYKMTAKLNSDMKIASNKTGYEFTKKLFDSDNDFKTNAMNEIGRFQRNQNYFNSTPKQIKAVNNAMKSLNNGKFDFNAYKAFNLTLADSRNQQHVEQRQKLYDALKKSGYSGLVDYNDKRMSGYNSKLPAIIFDSKNIDKLSKKNTKIDMNTINRKAAKHMVENLIKSSAKMGITVAAATKAATSLTDQTVKKNDNKIVREYRKEHPNSNLSYNEILKQHYNK